MLDFDEVSNILQKANDLEPEEMFVEDQLQYIRILMVFAEQMKPLVEKYAVKKKKPLDVLREAYNSEHKW